MPAGAPKALTPGGRRTFTAQFASDCATCSTAILPGDSVFYGPGAEIASGVDCCGDRDDAELTVNQRGDDSLSVDDEDPAVTIARTMPRGRTAADRCGKCWQIPASNGTCGCHA